MTTISPNDVNILYSPFTWDVNGQRAKTINAGAYLRVLFNGTPATLAATFDVSNQPAGKTRISFRVDQGPWQAAQVAASVPLPVPDDTWGSHTVEILLRSHSTAVNRWAAPQQTALLFTGLTADVAVTTRPLRPRPHRGLLVGDSLGEGVAAWSNAPTAYEDGFDSRLGWAYPLGDMLGAEVGVVAFGGVAYSDATSTAGVPKAPSSVPYLWDGQARSLSATPPDFVVVNLGTNDALHSNSDAAVTGDATALLTWILANTPASTPVIVVPGWEGFKAAPIKAAIAATPNSRRITYVDTSDLWFSHADSSDNLHPYGFANLSYLAPRLAAAIAPRIGAAGAVRMFMNDGNGNPVPVVVG